MATYSELSAKYLSMKRMALPGPVLLALLSESLLQGWNFPTIVYWVLFPITIGCSIRFALSTGQAFKLQNQPCCKHSSAPCKPAVAEHNNNAT